MEPAAIISACGVILGLIGLLAKLQHDKALQNAAHFSKLEERVETGEDRMYEHLQLYAQECTKAKENIHELQRRVRDIGDSVAKGTSGCTSKAENAFKRNT